MGNDTPSRASRHSGNNAPQKKPKKVKKKTKNSIGSVILKCLIGFFIIGCIGLLSGMGLFWFYAKDAPKIEDNKLDASVSSVIYASNNDIIADLGSENRKKISAQDVPQLLEDAVVSVEDRRFYKHIGVDPIRIVGSALSNVTKGGLQGGSTLTQQLIKLSYFSTKKSDQTLKRKAQEAWLALQLEQEKSKQEILTYYINKVYMANGLYGMETAADTYYGKDLKDLDLAQTALLAGMPQAPNAYDPYQHPEAAKERRDTVLYTMKENNKITDNEYQAAIKKPIKDGLKDLEKSSENLQLVDNYVKEVIEEVKNTTGKDVYTDGLEIHTNLDLNAQKRLYEIVNTDKYVNYPDEKLQVATTMVDVNTGKVLAQIGARNVPDNVVFGNNQAVSTARDFGSTVKPITDYGPAFENLNLSTAKRIDDAPYKYDGTNISVNNWDKQYMGNISLRTALYESRNVPAVKLFNDVGKENVTKFLNGLGIQYKDLVQSNAISSNTAQDGTKYGVSSLKMAAAYAAFANGGTYYKPQYVNKIVYQDGSSDEFKPEGKKAMAVGTAYMITDILKDVITQGTGTNAMIDGLIQAGKTGTSNYSDEDLEKIGMTDGISPDVTFVGYNRQYAISVWTGYEKHLTPITSESNMIASDVYRELMQYVAQNGENNDWKIPDDLIRVGNELYWRDKYEQSLETQPSYSQSQTIPSSKATSETQSESSSSTEESTAATEPEQSSSVAPTPDPSTPPESSTTPPESSSTPDSSTTPPSTSSAGGGN
ncbi:peptidoglycan glycosyltransferase [Enterococcus saigonensis]|uniref:Peptidoglycan glycosyltransferase n=1 Tax=Enterococcus saigonensis TaxID=1805431 RepID=A0A679IKI7_9ENTE|nr:PBP1A family penicillin-binding protein [Enterococcus saigonensis]BCA85776.1 peptidoglycan glycosyltransferase [Enterococcus saigonensis]